jgi:hypothetical protein
MDLEGVLSQIKPDRCNVHGGRLFRSVESLRFPLWHIDAV